jgi:hypothetical protein
MKTVAEVIGVAPILRTVYRNGPRGGSVGPRAATTASGYVCARLL